MQTAHLIQMVSMRLSTKNKIKRDLLTLSYIASVGTTVIYAYTWMSAFINGGKIMFNINEFGEANGEFFILIALMMLNVIGLGIMYDRYKHGS